MIRFFFYSSNSARGNVLDILNCDFDNVTISNFGDRICNYEVVLDIPANARNHREVEPWTIERSDMIRDSKSLDGPLRGLTGSGRKF